MPGICWRVRAKFAYMDFTEDLNSCLEALKQGQLVGIPGRAGWMLAGNATNETAMEDLMEIYGKCFCDTGDALGPVILLADERDFVQYISALDLAVFDWMALQNEPVAIWFDGIIGLAGCLLTESGAAAFTLVQDDFNKHLIKRFRLPLAALHVDRERLTELRIVLAKEHTKSIGEGFTRKFFV
jgi:L-threonylcarbamoyladenylate synthase